MDAKVEDIKLVVNELNRRLNKKLNVISFDNLKDESRIEMLLQVLREIDPTVNVESMAVADPEEVVARILELLRVLKYSPPPQIDLSTFRAGIISGEKAIHIHILKYLLQRLDDLKTRAYLARFLVKIEVSPDVEGDADIVALYQQYETLIENFKQIHTKKEQLKKSTSSVQELQRDVSSMEVEKETISAKLSSIKRQVDVAGKKALFDAVTAHRDEVDKMNKMNAQNIQQEQQLKQLSLQLIQVKDQLRDFQLGNQVIDDGRSLDGGSNDGDSEEEQTMGLIKRPSELIRRMEEEVASKRSLVTRLLPKEISSLTNHVSGLEEIEGLSEISPDILDRLNEKIESTNREVNTMIEKKMLSKSASIDSMSKNTNKILSLQKNASDVAERREEMKKKLSEKESQLKHLNEDLKEKRKSFDGHDIHYFKEFALNCKNKAGAFKEAEAELDEIKNEIGILVETTNKLLGIKKYFMKEVDDLEAERGIAGYFVMTEQSRDPNAPAASLPGFGRRQSVRMTSMQNESRENLNDTIKRLNDQITNKKLAISPTVNVLRPLRAKKQELVNEHETKKKTYGTTRAGLEANLTRLTGDVKKYEQEVDKLGSSEFHIKCELEVLTAYDSWITSDMQKSGVELDGQAGNGLPGNEITANESTGQKKESHDFQEMRILDSFKKEILAEQERQEELKIKQRYLKEHETENRKQSKLWKDLEVLMEAKKRGFERRQMNNSTRKNSKQDHLVL